MFATEEKRILKAWGSTQVWVSGSCGYLAYTRGSVIISSSTQEGISVSGDPRQ